MKYLIIFSTACPYCVSELQCTMKYVLAKTTKKKNTTFTFQINTYSCPGCGISGILPDITSSMKKNREIPQYIGSPDYFELTVMKKEVKQDGIHRLDQSK